MTTVLERTIDDSTWYFDKKTIENMKRLTSESKQDGLEHGGILCRDFGNEYGATKITLENECTGKVCSIKYPTKMCKNGTERLGTFHTHIHRKEFGLSYRDIKTFLDNNSLVSCIGTVKTENLKNVLCYKRQMAIDLETMIKEDVNINKNLKVEKELLAKHEQIAEELKKIRDYKKKYIDNFLYVTAPEFLYKKKI